MVPATMQEPIDIRFATDSEACNARNMQRHESTAIRYTTAASNPMQLKIEFLLALSKGKPILGFLMSKDKRVSALGRNVMAAIDMLSPEQQAKISVLAHGWGFHEALLFREAMKLAQEGRLSRKPMPPVPILPQGISCLPVSCRARLFVNCWHGVQDYSPKGSL